MAEQQVREITKEEKIKAKNTNDSKSNDNIIFNKSLNVVFVESSPKYNNKFLILVRVYII